MCVGSTGWLTLQAVTDEPWVGITYVPAVLTGPTGKQVGAQLMVDSGAKYTLLPYDVWQELGLQPKRTLTFQLADGTTIDRSLSECHIGLLDGDGHTPVILGEPGDAALLGVITLEELGLVFYPFERALRRAKLMPLASAAAS